MSAPAPTAHKAETSGVSVRSVFTALLALGALAGVAVLALGLRQNEERPAVIPEQLAGAQGRRGLQQPQAGAASDLAAQAELAAKPLPSSAPEPNGLAASDPTPNAVAPAPGALAVAVELPVEADPAVQAARAAEDARRHEEVMAAIAARERARATSSVAITMYSTSWCGACKHARDHMRAQGIAFDERDVEDDPAAKAQQLLLNPRGSVPTIDIDGHEVLVGFSAGHLDAAITRSVARRTGS
jgi:glutaredoxin